MTCACGAISCWAPNPSDAIGVVATAALANIPALVGEETSTPGQCSRSCISKQTSWFFQTTHSFGKNLPQRLRIHGSVERDRFIPFLEDV